jgi:broad specificity phosphatase PhoE
MSVLLLVRHGQASFGKRNYDALSDVGHAQARILGAALAARGVVPSRIVTGGMSRHAETVEGILSGLEQGPEVVVDDGWDEFNFDHVIQVHKPLYRSKALMFADFARTPAAERRARFQTLFEEATERWTGGGADHDYEEPFSAFSERVDGALQRTAADAHGTVVVVSSGGPIALVASRFRHHVVDLQRPQPSRARPPADHLPLIVPRKREVPPPSELTACGHFRDD